MKAFEKSKLVYTLTLAMLSIKLANAQCNVCNTTTLTACISVDQFTPCDANGVLNFNSITTCAAGSQCNHNLPTAPCTPGVTVACNSNRVPLPATSTTATTSTTSTTSTTTTASTMTPTFSAPTYCKSKVGGRYKHPWMSTCTTYVYCYEYNAVMTGAVYTCPPAANFNPSTGYCDPNYSC